MSVIPTCRSKPSRARSASSQNMFIGRQLKQAMKQGWHCGKTQILPNFGLHVLSPCSNKEFAIRHGANNIFGKKSGLKHLPVVRLISAKHLRVGCKGSFMILVWWAVFALSAGCSDVYVWTVHSIKLAILSLQWRMQRLSVSSLGALNF